MILLLNVIRLDAGHSFFIFTLCGPFSNLRFIYYIICFLPQLHQLTINKYWLLLATLCIKLMDQVIFEAVRWHWFLWWSSSNVLGNFALKINVIVFGFCFKLVTCQHLNVSTWIVDALLSSDTIIYIWVNSLLVNLLVEWIFK